MKEVKTRKEMFACPVPLCNAVWTPNQELVFLSYKDSMMPLESNTNTLIADIPADTLAEAKKDFQDYQPPKPASSKPNIVILDSKLNLLKIKTQLLQEKAKTNHTSVFDRGAKLHEDVNKLIDAQIMALMELKHKLIEDIAPYTSASVKEADIQIEDVNCLAGNIAYTEQTLKKRKFNASEQFDTLLDTQVQGLEKRVKQLEEYKAISLPYVRVHRDANLCIGFTINNKFDNPKGYFRDPRSFEHSCFVRIYDKKRIFINAPNFKNAIWCWTPCDGIAYVNNQEKRVYFVNPDEPSFHSPEPLPLLRRAAKLEYCSGLKILSTHNCLSEIDKTLPLEDEVQDFVVTDPTSNIFTSLMLISKQRNLQANDTRRYIEIRHHKAKYAIRSNADGSRLYFEHLLGHRNEVPIEKALVDSLKFFCTPGLDYTMILDKTKQIVYSFFQTDLNQTIDMSDLNNIVAVFLSPDNQHYLAFVESGEEYLHTYCTITHEKLHSFKRPPQLGSDRIVNVKLLSFNRIQIETESIIAIF